MRPAAILLPVALLAACATQPTGPTVAVMPGPHKTLAEFQRDNAECKQFAGKEVAGGSKHANNMQAFEAIGGTLLGGGLGAALGGGKGALIGAGIGGVGGAGIGGLSASHTGSSMQARYDVAFIQCMYVAHNVVPTLTAGTR